MIPFLCYLGMKKCRNDDDRNLKSIVNPRSQTLYFKTIFVLMRKMVSPAFFSHGDYNDSRSVRSEGGLCTYVAHICSKTMCAQRIRENGRACAASERYHIPISSNQILVKTPSNATCGIALLSRTDVHVPVSCKFN